MKKVNLGEKYTHRLTLRLNDSQFEYIMNVSNILGVSPSDYLRMCVNTGMVACQQGLTINSPLTNLEGEKVGTHEDVKTNIDDKL